MISISAQMGTEVSCRWFFNGTEIPGETEIYLYKEDITLEDAGEYSCEVTLGSVTNTASLEIEVAPAFDFTIVAEKGGRIIEGENGKYGEEVPVYIEAEEDPGYIFEKWIATDGGVFSDEWDTYTAFYNVPMN